MKRLVAAALAFLPSIAWAQPQCAPRADAAVLLATVYGETVQATANDPSGAMVQFWANVDTGTWTLTVIPTGQPETMCFVSSGFGFVGTPQPAAARGEAL